MTDTPTEHEEQREFVRWFQQGLRTCQDLRHPERRRSRCRNRRQAEG
jgi:hypothetical protein